MCAAEAGEAGLPVNKLDGGGEKRAKHTPDVERGEAGLPMNKLEGGEKSTTPPTLTKYRYVAALHINFAYEVCSCNDPYDENFHKAKPHSEREICHTIAGD